MNINNLIADHGLTIAQIARKTHTSISTLSTNAKKDPYKWTIRVLNSFSSGLGMTDSELLKLITDQRELYNDPMQEIMGYHVADLKHYLKLKQVVVACERENIYLTDPEIRSLITCHN